MNAQNESSGFSGSQRESEQNAGDGTGSHSYPKGNSSKNFEMNALQLVLNKDPPPSIKSSKSGEKTYNDLKNLSQQ